MANTGDQRQAEADRLLTRVTPKAALTDRIAVNSISPYAPPLERKFPPRVPFGVHRERRKPAHVQREYVTIPT